MFKVNILTDEIWEPDKGSQTDDKINKMLDLYFRESNLYIDEDSPKKKDNGEHIYIDFVEFRNYKQDFNKGKEIYPGKNNSKPSDSSNTLFYICVIYIFAFYLTLIFIPKTIGYIIFLIIMFLFGAFLNFLYVAENELFVEYLDEKNLKKLHKILNSKPNLELCLNNDKISIPFHSYADISGISFTKDGNNEKINFEKINLDNKMFLYFPVKFLYFVDSTQQYFKFLIIQFNKYCMFDSKRGFEGIYKKMYLKFYLTTKDKEVIYKNDPMFSKMYSSFNNRNLKILIYLGIFTLLSPIIVKIINSKYKRKIVEIKKTVSIKHNLENYLKLDSLFPRITLSDQKLKREVGELISDKDSIQKEFIQECNNLCEKIKRKIEYYIDGEPCFFPGFLADSHDLELERDGYLTPFHSNSGFSQSKNVYELKDFYKIYGRKIEKILKRNPDDVFQNFRQVLSHDFDDSFNYNVSMGSNNAKGNKVINNNAQNLEKPRILKQVVYTEKTLTLKIDINKHNVIVNYTVKLSDGRNKNGKFQLEKKLGGGGFEKLEEKVNVDWTKSEIYIPGCNDVIEIVRKKRGIKLSGGDFEEIFETKINEDLLSGFGSWINGNEWDKRTMNKFVKPCNRNSTTNRFMTK